MTREEFYLSLWAGTVSGLGIFEGSIEDALHINTNVMGFLAAQNLAEAHTSPESLTHAIAPCLTMWSADTRRISPTPWWPYVYAPCGGIIVPGRRP
jgi:hypothetical protein